MNPNIEGNLRLHAERVEQGENPGVPIGALKLGCGNCRIGDMTQHPELGTLYCAVCPVTHRQQRLEARRNGNDAYYWQGRQHNVEEAACPS